SAGKPASDAEMVELVKKVGRLLPKVEELGLHLSVLSGLGAGSTGSLPGHPQSSQRHHPPQTRKQGYFFGYSANHYFDTVPLSGVTLLLKNPSHLYFRTETAMELRVGLG